MAFTENTIADYTATQVYAVMQWASPNYWLLWAGVMFFACMLSLAPWKLDPDHDGLDLVLHFIRRSIFWTAMCLIAGLGCVYFFYDMTWRDRLPNHTQMFLDWFWGTTKSYGWTIPIAALLGYALRFWYFRFIHPWWSSMLRDWRNLQVTERESDVRTESERFKAKDYLPAKHYAKDNSFIFVGLDEHDEPLTVPVDTWLETNMQVIGPTRYGKGVVTCTVMDQVIRRGDGLIYIDPKDDKFAPHVMLQACMDTRRPFIYLNLREDGFGYWSPFEGGSHRDAYSRLTNIFGMQEGGSESDFYKVMEKKLFNRIIKMGDSFRLEAIYQKIKSHNDNSKDVRDKALKIEAQLENWRQIGSLNPQTGAPAFSVESALMENAIVYVQGSLTDETVKTATKAMIMEIIQEAQRLKSQRQNHLTLVVDEASFLVSKILKDALATVVGARVNIVLMYQSMLDLRAVDDVNLDGEALLQAVNINSQLKLIYGGADADTAEWVAKMSGTIVKEVTSMERTDVRTAGAEEWERGRTIKHHEEALIPENVVLTLPPRVCVLFQPRKTAMVAHTAFVPVKDMARLPKWLAEQRAELEQSIAVIQHAESAEEQDIYAPSAQAGAAIEATSPPAQKGGNEQKYDIPALLAAGLETLPDDTFYTLMNAPKRRGKIEEAVGAEAYKQHDKRYKALKKLRAGDIAEEPVGRSVNVDDNLDQPAGYEL